ncbi:MAG: AAA family ATPase [Gulosibacter sp.]|uniref:AAA family ATPase n=1 Tax=Gulosibacter sp. TaxID=2817531 RepID=UPI003F90AE26
MLSNTAENGTSSAATLDVGTLPDVVLVASTLAAQCWPVIPLDHSKRPAFDGQTGENHRHAWLTSPGQVIGASEAFPQEFSSGRKVWLGGFGVILGERNEHGLALVVFDTDSDQADARFLDLVRGVPGGPEWLAATLTATTGRGRHYYATTTAPLPTVAPWHDTTRPDEPANALDVKGSGYVVVPGSLHPSGAIYRDATERGGVTSTNGAQPPWAVAYRGVKVDEEGTPRVEWSAIRPMPNGLPAALGIEPSTEAHTVRSATHGRPSEAAQGDGSAFARVVERLRGLGRLARTDGTTSAIARCPAHDDRSPSLSVTRKGDRVLTHCHAGCSYSAVMSALGLSAAAGYDDAPSIGSSPTMKELAMTANPEITIDLSLGGDGDALDETPSTASEVEPEPLDQFEKYVQLELQRMRVRDEAKERRQAELAAIEAEAMPPFDAGTLGEILARPDEPAHLVDGLVLWAAFTLVVAQRKTGKTTFCLNLARSLISGTDFLGRFKVRMLAPNERVALLNYEVSGKLVASWAERIGIPEDRLVIVNLRGRRNPFMHKNDLEQLAAYLRELNVVTVMGDPFSRMFTGDNANDAGQVTSFISAFDTWARSEVGARDVVMTAHAGWEGERARNSSALEDAPDSIITLTTGARTGDPKGRYLRALGRDVEVDEDRMHFDEMTLHMTLSGLGSRQETGDSLAIERLVPDVVQYVTDNPGCSQNAVCEGVDGKAERIRKAIKLADERNLIRREAGRGRALLHYPTDGQGSADVERGSTEGLEIDNRGAK